MNKTTKELISEYLPDQTKKFDLVHADAFTTVAISDALHISRTITSQQRQALSAPQSADQQSAHHSGNSL